MSRIRSEKTSIEIKVGRYLWSEGYRYRTHYSITGKPDIAFPGKHIALFINGCFWHRHGCRLSYIPRSRKEFWTEKLERNVARDKEVKLLLGKLGWKTKVIWECEIESDFNGTMNALTEFLRENRNKDE